VVGFLFALSDEVHQYFAPGHSADVFDLLVDFVGILLSLFLTCFIVRNIVNSIQQIIIFLFFCILIFISFEITIEIYEK